MNFDNAEVRNTKFSRFSIPTGENLWIFSISSLKLIKYKLSQQEI